MAFLDCNNATRYPMVNHTLMGTRAMGVRLANMIFDMYIGAKHVKVHGAGSRPKQGNNGLVAGCALAKELLKAFLGPV